MRKKKNKKLLWALIAFSIILTVVLLHEGTPKMRVRTLNYFLKITPTVAIATFLGSVFELRNWIRWMKAVLKPLVSFGHLPNLSGVTMVMSLFSNKSARAMLSGALDDGTISRGALRTTAMCNSYLAFLSHSLRIAWPAVGAAGMAAILYFGIQFSLGFLIILTALIVHRMAVGNTGGTVDFQTETPDRQIPDWPTTFKRAATRTGKLLLRLLFISVPCYLLVLHLTAMGIFDLWQDMMPEQMARFFPAEVMAVTVGMLGGIVNAATLGGEFMNSDSLSVIQVVFAMLVGSAVGNPVRTIRRNLPSAMGIFHPRDGLFVVGVMQGARFVTVVAVCVVLALFMM